MNKRTIIKVYSYGFFLVFFSGLFLVSCSTKKDTLLSRSYHGLTTKFNVLYNGQVSLDEGVEEVRMKFKDNFWDLLPIERMTLEENRQFSIDSKSPQFKRAEEKAVKAVQKHSMQINGKQRNKQIDEAYLLLGKSRYYDQRFIPALEAFNFALEHFPESDGWNQAVIWRAKTLVRLGRAQAAIESIERLLNAQALKDEELSAAQSALSMAYLALDQTQEAIDPLKKVMAFEKNHETAARHIYLLGQLYENLQYADSAALAFQQVVNFNRKIPRKYWIHAQLALLRIDTLTSVKKLAYQKLLKNRENRPFLDRIYFEKAQFLFQQQETDSAIVALNKALHSPLEDRRLKAKGYEQLSVYAFEQKNYLNAAAYLDSTLNFLESKTRKHRALTRKRASLDEIITYEKTIEKTDSVLALVEMSAEKRQLFFEEMLQEQEKARQKMATENAISQQGLSGSALSNPMGVGTFYFYSPNQLMMGKQQFKNTWKNRAAVDNWRYVREKAVVAEVEEIEVPKLDFSAAAKELVATIPSNPKEIDSLRENRAGAYYDAGLSYKEQFNDLSLSAERLTQFIETDLLPKRRPAALYHLYRAFEKIDPQQLLTTKAQLQAAYPDSKYLKILENPAAMKADLEIMHQKADSLMANYGRIDFEKTISEVEVLLKKDIEPALAAKLSLLNAKAIGRLDGPEAYIKALENTAAQYPKQESGLEAASLIASIQSWEAPTYDFESNEPSKLVFLFELKEKPQAISLTEKLNKILTELENEDLSISLDRYDRSQFMVVVHGFRSRDAAEGFSEMIQKTPAFLVNRDNFVVLLSDFKKALIFKHLDRFIKP